MITGAILACQQLNYLRKADVGFENENVMVLEIQDTAFRRKAETFRLVLPQNHDISITSLSFGIPGGRNGIQVMRVEKEDKMQEYALYLIPCDYNFLDLLKLN